MMHRRTIYDHPRGFSSRPKTQKAELAHGTTSVEGWDDRLREIFQRLQEYDHNTQGAR